MRTLSKTVAVSPTITAGAYSANDAVGGLMTFSNATNSKLTGVIQTVVITDQADQGAALDLVCFNQSVTVASDNDAFSISDDDSKEAVAWISVTASDYIDVGGAKVAVIGGIGQLVTTYNGTALYCQLRTTGTPTYAATDDLQVAINVLQD